MLNSEYKMSVRVALGLLLVVVTAITILIAVALQYHFSKKSELDHTLKQYHVLSSQIKQKLSYLDDEARGAALKTSEAISLSKFKDKPETLIRFFSTVLAHSPNIYSLYIADKKDNTFQLINLHSPKIRQKLMVSPSERWLAIKHVGSGKERYAESLYLDSELNIIKKSTKPSNFLPSQRIWFKKAQHNRVYRSDPYLFNQVKITGISYSTKIADTDLVLGVDLNLSTIQSFLDGEYDNQAFRPSFEAYLFLSDGRLIATNQQINIQHELPVLSALELPDNLKAWVENAPKIKVSSLLDWEPIDFAISGHPHGFAIDLLDLIADISGLHFDYINGETWSELVDEFKTGKLDLLHSVANNYEANIPNANGLPLFQSPYAIAQLAKPEIINQPKQLSDKTIAIKQGWTNYEDIRATFKEVNFVQYPSLDKAFRDIQDGTIDGVLDNALVLKRGVKTLSSPKIQISLIASSLINDQFYLLSQQDQQPLNQVLKLALEHIDDRAMTFLIDKWAGDNIIYTHVPHPELMQYANNANAQGQLIDFAKDGIEYYLFVEKLDSQPNQNITVLMPKSEVMSSINQRSYYFLMYSLTILSLFLVMTWFIARPFVKPIKELEAQAKLISERRYDKVKAVPSHVREISDLSNSVIGMSKALKQYEDEQKHFIDSFIKLVADAIDDKSHYTGAHCLRVPEIGMMLAEEAHKANSGHFSAFKFANQDEWREFRIAAFLHDCGKITTPEFVVNKGTKLETNYNRIHEIRTRFEVLWRDAEIEALHQVAEFPDDKPQIDLALKTRQSELLQQFDLIASYNIGSEFMSDESIAELKKIGKQTWLRNFDETKGLSPFERNRFNVSSKALPAKEPLLSDKVSHLIRHPAPYHIDAKFGIKMEVPDYLYNLGELYNLSIRKGTLTAEERFKINEHMISGIKMLDNIPFPDELKRVPRYASSHHETMKGTGYPRKLAGEELSIPERILALSDVFEALTAADRPYKQAKTLKQAMDIIYYMVVDEHLDKEVFKLFIETEVYLKYAEKYLTAEQFDDVDVSQYKL